MKKILRMLIFSGVALLATSYWNKGFILSFETYSFVILVLAVAVLYYIVRPISKIILLPINIITFGLISFAVYCFLFYIVTSQFSIINIKEWIFPGISYFGMSLPKLSISSFQNIVLSSLSVSVIINLLEKTT